jgi:DNA polymerase-3 subunit chi
MTEILFYHLQHQPLERVLPTLLHKSLERGWNVVVEVPAEERLQALDDHLWTYSDDGFLPHGTDKEPDAAGQPVLLTTGEGRPNGAQIRFLVDGAALPADPSGYERIVLVFDGNDEEALARARADWTKAKETGAVATYWQQDEDGRWQKRA